MAAPGRTSLRALLTANAISITGNKMTLLAIPWFVLQTTGSPSRTALAGFFSFLPVALSSFLGGPLIDRIGFKRMRSSRTWRAPPRLPPSRCCMRRSASSSGNY